MLAVFRSDGAVLFITLMLGDDCCIFHITINKAPGAVFPLVGPARGSGASDPQRRGFAGPAWVRARGTCLERRVQRPPPPPAKSFV